MERLAQLIGKLNEQFEQNADPAQLLVTTQLIEAELLRQSTAPQKVLGTSKIAVVMPAANRAYKAEAPVLQQIDEQLVVNKPVEKNGHHNGKQKEEQNGWQF